MPVVGDAQFVNTEVGDFQHESVVDDTVGTFEPSVRFDVRVMQVRHALDKTPTTVEMRCPELKRTPTKVFCKKKLYV